MQRRNHFSALLSQHQEYQMRFRVLFTMCIAGMLSVFPVLAQSADPQPATHSARTIAYHPRDLVTLRTRVHYTTLIVLPAGEEVVEATCGDKEFWIVNVRDGLVSVKPAKPGGETNLNVMTASGQLYAFVLTETSSAKSDALDLTVYLEPDDPAQATGTHARPSYVPAQQLEDYRTQAALARDDARRATETARKLLEDGISEFRNSYPLSLSFPYRYAFNKAPFFIQAIFHDDHRTFLQVRTRELPSLYELKDGRPNVVNYTVHDGTYIVSKVLESGYLSLGKAHVIFDRIDRQR
jgi:conjugative transfer protein CagX